MISNIAFSFPFSHQIFFILLLTFLLTQIFLFTTFPLTNSIIVQNEVYLTPQKFLFLNFKKSPEWNLRLQSGFHGRGSRTAFYFSFSFAYTINMQHSSKLWISISFYKDAIFNTTIINKFRGNASVVFFFFCFYLTSQIL